MKNILNKLEIWLSRRISIHKLRQYYTSDIVELILKVEKESITEFLDKPITKLFYRDAYFVVPRLALESLPHAWQIQFVELIRQANEDHGLETPDYYISRKDNHGKFIRDWWLNYRGETVESCMRKDKQLNGK